MAKKDIKDGEDPFKTGKKVASIDEIPKGAVKKKDSSGREYYEISTETPAKKSKTPTDTYVVKKRTATVPPKSTTPTPEKKQLPPSQSKQTFYLDAPTTTPKVPTFEDKERAAFQGLGYEGKRLRNPKLTESLPPFYIGGKQAEVIGYDIPAKRDTTTGAWSSNEGMSTGGEQVYGVTDPTTGEFKLVNIPMMQGKERDIQGENRYVYTEEDIVPYVNPTNVAQNLKSGAVRQGADESYLNSLGVPVDRTQDVIGPVNTGGTGFGTLKKTEKIPDLPALKTSGLKKGGLVDKYDIGGPIINPQIKNYYDQLNPATQQGINAVTNSVTQIAPQAKTGLGAKFKALPSAQKASIYSAAGDIAGTGLDILDRKDERSSIAGQAGVSALKGAGKGAALGSMLGPAGTVVGAGIGLVAGAAMGASRGKKEKQARIDDTAAEMNANVIDAQTFDPNNPNKVYKAQTYNEKDYRKGLKGLFAKGGKITGSGTGTSDSVNAKLKEGSFIVPAKNAGIAAKIRKEMLGGEEKASLNHGGGVRVKVSNGEHLFTPEEVKELTAAGYDLDKLAPEAKTKLRSEYAFKCGGMMKYKDGGLTSAKAKVMLKEGIANNHRLTDKQKGYFGAVAGGNNYYKDGGEIENDQVDPKKELEKIKAQEELAYQKRLKEAKSKKEYNEILDNYKDRISKRNKWKSTYEQESKAVEAKQKEYQDFLKYAANKDKWTIDESEEKIAAKKKQILNKLQEYTDAQSKAKTTYDYLNDDKNFDKTTGVPKIRLEERKGTSSSPVSIKGTSNLGVSGFNNKTQPTGLTSTTKAKPRSVSSIKETIEPLPTLPVNTDLTPVKPEGELRDVYTPTVADKSQYLQNKFGTSPTLADQVASGVKPQSQRNNFGIGDAIGLGLAGAQAGYGIQQLLKDKRPIGEIDPAFNTATNEAIAQSRYGYSPEQRSLLSQQITQGRVGQTAAINAIAGGNASVALGNTRAAINNEVANRLKMSAEDERLRMQKQQYATGLVGQRAGMKRQLFDDKMNMFMQNQQAGAQLLGAGIQNLSGLSRYVQERNAQEQIDKIRNSYLNTLP